MLLLFWKVSGIEVGIIHNIRWYHDPTYQPTYICGAEWGLTVINPSINESIPECSYFLTPNPVTSSTVFENSILAGTTNGIYSLSWPTVKQASCDVFSPQDLSAFTHESYTTGSGLPSNNILSMDSLENCLAILTTSGLFWKKSGTEAYLTCLTQSGVNVFLTAGPTLYLAEQNQLRIKRGEPTDFSSWDTTISYSDSSINRVFVNTCGGQDIIFVATTSGLSVRQGSNVINYYTVLSGTKDLHDVVCELDSHWGWGHVFVSSSGGVNVLNLKSGLVEKYMDFNGIDIPAIGYPRLYSK